MKEKNCKITRHDFEMDEIANMLNVAGQNHFTSLSDKS